MLRLPPLRARQAEKSIEEQPGATISWRQGLFSWLMSGSGLQPLHDLDCFPPV